MDDKGNEGQGLGPTFVSIADYCLWPSSVDCLPA